MDWIVIALCVIVFMLWWIRWALEPVRRVYQRKLNRAARARMRAEMEAAELEDIADDDAVPDFDDDKLSRDDASTEEQR